MQRRLFFFLFLCLPALPLSVRAAEPSDALRRVLKDLPSRRTEVINIQRELVARPALGPEAGGEGEEGKAHWLLTLLQSKGIRHVERLDSVDKVKSLDPDARFHSVRPNIIVRHPGSAGPEGRTLWIVCHLHVAAPGPAELWKGSPWTLRVEGDTLYGRGVMDNYQSITAALLLFQSLADNAVTPALNLGLVLHSQNTGIRHLLAAKPELFKRGDLFLAPDYGNTRGSVMGTAEKGLLWLKLTFSGIKGHASDPPPSSALLAGSRLIAALPDLAGRFSSADPPFAAPATSITPTRAATGEDGVNAVAASYAVYLDCRFASPYSLRELEQAIRALAEKTAQENGAGLTMETLLTSPALPATPADSPVARALVRAVTAQFPSVETVTPAGSGIVTAASFLRARGFPAVAWGKIDPARRQIANEYALISDHLDEAAVFARLLLDPEWGEATIAASARAPAPAATAARAGSLRESAAETNNAGYFLAVGFAVFALLLFLLHGRLRRPADAGEKTNGRAEDPLAPLTDRERQIAALVALGSSNTEICAVLHISEGTLRVHLRHIYRKTGATDRETLKTMVPPEA